MLSALRRLLLYRLLGARLMIGLAVFNWLRRQLASRRERRVRGRASGAWSGSSGRSGGRARGSAYQPSQGASQIVQREPR